MRVRLRTILGVLVSSLLADGVLAGIISTPVAQKAIPELQDPAPCSINLTLCGPDLTPLVRVCTRDVMRLHAGIDTGIVDSGSAGAVVPLPPGPGSASLVACGLALLSAVGGLRTLRRAHFGPLPEWYSTTGPRQIGHATPLDLESPVFLQRAFETVDPAVTLDSVEPIEVDPFPRLERLTRTRPRAPPAPR